MTAVSVELAGPACWLWPVTDDDRQHVLRASLAASEDARLDVLCQLLDEWQAGRCALCGGTVRRLVHDHDHDTGELRGLLCGSCNGREGHSDAADVQRYRSRPPAVMLGICVRYATPDSAQRLMACNPAEALGQWQAQRDPARRR